MTLPEAAAALRAAGIEAPAREARLLLAHALGLPPGAVPSPRATPPPAYADLVARRMSREPLAYITGRQGFWTLDLAVSAATLVPRADSETLIEALLVVRPDRVGVARVLDLGTGTGALLLATLAEYPTASGVGVDCSPAACTLAHANAAANGLADRAAFVCGNWADALDARFHGPFDVVLSNPPYIPRDAIAALQAEVARYEPATALDGGPDGLDAYRAILPALPALLASDGIALLEHGAGQGRSVAALAAACGLRVVGHRADLGGIDRVVVVDHARAHDYVVDLAGTAPDGAGSGWQPASALPRADPTTPAR